MDTVGINGPFYFFDGNTRPVRHFQIGPGIGIEQCRLPTVRIADESDSHPFRRLCTGVFHSLGDMFFPFFFF